MVLLHTDSIFKFTSTIYAIKYIESGIHRIIKGKLQKVIIFIRAISFEFHVIQMIPIMYFS